MTPTLFFDNLEHKRRYLYDGFFGKFGSIAMVTAIAQCSRLRKKLVAEAKGDGKQAIGTLADYDELVAEQAAGLLRAGVSPSDKDMRAGAKPE